MPIKKSTPIAAKPAESRKPKSIPPTGGPGVRPFPVSAGGMRVSPTGKLKVGPQGWTDEDGYKWWTDEDGEDYPYPEEVDGDYQSGEES